MNKTKNIIKRLFQPILFLILWLTRKKLQYSTYTVSKKRILIDCTGINNTIKAHGIQRVVQNLAKNIYRLSKDYDIEIQTIGLYREFIFTRPLSSCDGSIIENEKSPSLFKRTLKRVIFYCNLHKNAIKIGSNDILLYINPFPLSKQERLKSFKNNSKGTVVYIIHDLIPLQYPQFFKEDVDTLFSQWINNTFEYADAYICVSKTTQKDFQSYMLEQNINPAKYLIDTIRLGADIPVSNHSNLYIRNTIQDIFKTHKSVYLTVSTIEPRKNHRYLLDTFEKLWDQLHFYS